MAKSEQESELLKASHNVSDR